MKQLSVFIENRDGRLEKVAEILKKADINIISLSLADTSEYGVLRMLVTRPEDAKQCLKEEEFSAILTEVIVVKLENEPGKLHELLLVLVKEDISVEYMYAAANVEEPSIVLKVNDAQKAGKVLEEAGYMIYQSK